MADDQIHILTHELEQVADNMRKKTAKKIVKDLASCYLGEVKRLTPVGKKLKRTVTIKGEKVELHSDTQHMRKSWKLDPTITELAGTYQMLVYNSADYASFVNDGHRQEPGRYVPILGKRLVKNFVKGLHMTDDAERYTQECAPKIIEKQLNKVLEKLK